MGQQAITITSVNDPVPSILGTPIVEWRAHWTDNWTYEPELRVTSVSHRSAADGLGTCQLMREYGETKQPYENDFVTRRPWSMGHLWVRVSLILDGGIQVLFIGRVDNEADRVLEIGDINDATRITAGVQQWVAYAPLRILEKIKLSSSWWLEDGTEKEIGWIPDINGRDDRRLLVGNRSETQSGGTYLYGGQVEWSHLDYAHYLLKRFVEQPTGPSWRVAGAVNALANLKEHIRFSNSQSVADILAQLIPLSRGLDYLVQAYDAGAETGFEIYVFALQAFDWGFNNAVLPRNPFTVDFEGPLPTFIKTLDVNFSGDNLYSKVRVVGSRIVSCLSLRADDQTLEKKWPDTLEASYLAGTGDPLDKADQHDAARIGERYRSVFQLYAAPVDWDLNSGTAAPLLDLSGNLTAGVAVFQKQVRKTLRWTPLREGVDYSVDPPLDNNIANYEPDLLPPAAWLLNTAAWGGLLQRYVLAEEANISVNSLGLDWGVFLQARPNHLLAKNHWLSAQPAAQPSNHLPFYDFEDMAVTIAIDSDQRLQLGYDVPPLIQHDPDGSVIEIQVPDAEFWWLTPNTIVGINDDGTLKLAPSDGIILRNDADRLAVVAAGALARYVASRQRVTVRMEGLIPWTDLVGRVITVINTAAQLENGHGLQTFTVNIFAPITAIDFRIGDGENPTTTLSAGYVQ